MRTIWYDVSCRKCQTPLGYVAGAHPMPGVYCEPCKVADEEEEELQALGDATETDGD